MISASAIGRSKEEIKCKSFNLDEPVDPFNYMLTTYPPVSLLITSSKYDNPVFFYYLYI